MAKILIVEDEQHLADGLKFNLEAEGYHATLAADGETALDLILEQKSDFDAIVLDVMLPGKDGFEIARELRQADCYIPILMLTARGRPEDILSGFEAGADDYLPKPFELKILIARLGGLLRRREWFRLTEDRPGKPSDGIFNFSGKSIDFDALTLTAGDRVIHLTLMEADLLRFLIRHQGETVSRRQILEEVWGLREDTDTRAIDNFMVRLRRYIEDDPSNPRHLVTVRGVGYRFEISRK
ncbi:MAG: response regulator transcription factor [Acidobacteriota bacterium]|nr:MAG: response regulator transcription factor [Acidobacteriota bacterium]